MSVKVGAPPSPVDFLWRLSVNRGLPKPEFVEISLQGPPHMRTFVYECSFHNVTAQGAGRSAKEAKKAAAKAVKDRLDLDQLPDERSFQSIMERKRKAEAAAKDMEEQKPKKKYDYEAHLRREQRREQYRRQSEEQSRIEADLVRRRSDADPYYERFDNQSQGYSGSDLYTVREREQYPGAYRAEDMFERERYPGSYDHPSGHSSRAGPYSSVESRYERGGSSTYPSDRLPPERESSYPYNYSQEEHCSRNAAYNSHSEPPSREIQYSNSNFYEETASSTSNQRSGLAFGFSVEGSSTSRVQPRNLSLPAPVYAPSWPDQTKMSKDDRLVMDKYKALCLREFERRAVDTLLAHTERCVSLATDAVNAGDAERPLLRAERVGDAAKDTVGRESDRTLVIVLMCRKRPGQRLLEEVSRETMLQLAAFGRYEVSMLPKEAGFCVASANTSFTVHVVLTSTVIQFEVEERLRTPSLSSGKSLDDQTLPEEACLRALSWLRQAKWFCAASKRQPALSTIVVVLRSVFRHEQHWSALTEWDVEVVCQTALADQGGIMPLKAIEKVLKLVSEGALGADPMGLPDPCGTTGAPVAAQLHRSQKEALAHSAASMLGLIRDGLVSHMLAMGHEDWAS